MFFGSFLVKTKIKLKKKTELYSIRKLITYCKVNLV